MSLSILSHLNAVIAILLIARVMMQIFTIEHQLRQNATRSFLLALFCIWVWIFLTHIRLILEDDGGVTLVSTFIGLSANIIVLSGLFFLTLFSRYHISPFIHYIKYGVLQGMIGVILGLGIVEMILIWENQMEILLWIIIAKGIGNAIILICALGLILLDFQQLLKENLTEAQKAQIQYVVLSMIIGIGGMVPLNALSIFYGIEIFTIGYVVVAIAMAFASYGYSKDPRISFLIPDQANLLLIVNSHGVLKYYQGFTTSTQAISDNYLLSSALTAIRDVMSDFYKHEVVPKNLMLNDQFIQFKFTRDYFVAVFSKYQSKLIERALDEVVDRMEEKYHQSLTYTMNNGLLLDVDDIVFDTFYFAFPKIREKK